MARYAIGDVQGCFDALRRLLTQIDFDAARDRLWFVGDLVNRGPDSLATLRFVRGLRASAITVLGNHDLHLLSVAAGIKQQKAGDTLDEVLSAPERADILQWLRCRPLMHVEDEFVMLHAGLLPQWSIEQAAALAKEVEAVLQSPDSHAFLRTMYGNQPNAWSDTLSGSERLRVITNAFTRLRICTQAGAMEFDYKGTIGEVPEGYVPWFDVKDRRSQDKILIAGHWSALGLHQRSNLIALDSGCFWGGKLTAVRLEDRAVFQVDCQP